MKDFWKELADWTDQGAPFALATVVSTQGSAPRKPGARMLIRGDKKTFGTIGGGALEHQVVESALALIKAGTPRLFSYKLKDDLDMKCGGSAEVFVEPIVGGERLYIFGAGHVGAALCDLAVKLGFQVTVLDTREELLAEARLPSGVDILQSFDPLQWGGLAFDQRTYCVVTTFNHAMDLAIVRALMERDLGYLGMIGSMTKRRAVEQALTDDGVAAERIAELHTPMGLPISAQTPAEIAVSIAAELIQSRYQQLSPSVGTTEPEKKPEEEASKKAGKGSQQRSSSHE